MLLAVENHPWKNILPNKDAFRRQNRLAALISEPMRMQPLLLPGGSEQDPL